MKIFLSLFATVLITLPVFSQNPDKSANSDSLSIAKKFPGNTRIYGKVMDLQGKDPIPLASIQLSVKVYDAKYNRIKDSIIAAMLSEPNGDFNFADIPLFDKIMVMVSAVDYSLYTTSVNLRPGLPSKDIGNIVMARNAQRLKEVLVTLDNPQMRLGIDKKVFDVDKSLTSRGGTAIDAIKNIPSVSVDVDGNVELRNSSPTIFIDGRPTILTLDQISADNIDRVEIITNPSAKYDASTTGGIINIILKKNKRTGINGIVSTSVGTQGIFSANANVNLRQGKFNFFVSGNYNESGGNANSKSFRQNKRNGVIGSYFNQLSKNQRSRKFTSTRFGVDYFIDNRSTFTVSHNIVNGRFGNEEIQDQEYLNSDKILDRYGSRTSLSSFSFDNSSTEALYTLKFPREGKQLDASINLNYGSGGNGSNILNTFFNDNGTQYSVPNIVRNDGSSDENQLTAKIDFVSPVGEDQKIETGVRTYVNNYESIFNSFSLQNGSETKLPLSNNYIYKEVVHAAYLTYTGKMGSIGYQAGFRAEFSKFTGELVDSARSFGYEYPDKLANLWNALFPSLYLSKKIGESVEIQLNYSKRIRRPRFWNLNPFVDINDPLNIRRGNPELKPEFSNSFEFNYSKTFKNRSNFLGVIYYRNILQDITNYSDTITAAQFAQLNNAAVDPNAILNTFINAKSNNRIGIELTLQQKVGKNFNITPTFNINYRKVSAVAGKTNLNNEGYNWSAELTANYKIVTEQPSFFNKFSFQLSGEYESPRVIPQGKRLEQFDSDFAIRRDLFEDDKGSITFSINDIFNTRRYGVLYDTDTFYQESYRRWRVRSFRLTLSYKFGNSEFSLFKRNRGNGNGGGGEDDEGAEM
jgi:outer membrane receptor protein involved in Fe transport